MVGLRQFVVLQALCYGELRNVFSFFFLFAEERTTGVLAQTTTQLFVAGFDDTNSLSGEVIGTGAEGTTYILEGVDVLNTTTIAFTSA